MCARNSEQMNPEKKYQQITREARKMIRLLENDDVHLSKMQQKHYLKKLSNVKRNRKALSNGLFSSLSCRRSKANRCPELVCTEPGSNPSKKCFSYLWHKKGPPYAHHDCLPYSIEYEERCGRLLRATRDILAGEIIFTDLQGVVGPRPAENPPPVCLACYRRLSRLSYRCQQCGWPLCSYYCSKGRNSLHARECTLFRRNRRRCAGSSQR